MPIESIALPAPNAPSSLSVRLPSISELTQQACLPVSDKQMLPRGPLPTLGHLRQAVYSPTALPPSAKPSVPVTPKTAEHQPQQEAYQLHTPPAVSSQLSPRMTQLYYPQQYPNQVYPPSSYYPQPVYYTGQQHAPVPMPPQQGPAPPPPPAQGFQHQPGMMPPYPVHHHQYVVPEVINKPINKCHRCGTTETPEWRRGPNGVRTLCNACGLFHAKLVKRKGAALAAEEVLNNKVCKGKNGRRISIKKHLLNESLLKSTPILQPHPGAGAGNLPLPVVMNGGYPMYPLQMIRH